MKRIVTELIQKGKVVSRAKLGITYTAINSVAAEVGGYKQQGLYVASVAEDSDLYTKVNEGDIITQINGIDVTSDNIVLDIIEQSSAGDKITVTVVSKNGSTKTLQAVLRANVSESSYTEIETPNANQNPGNNGGGSFTFPFGE
jgi:S1-C subfamily serine protease